MSEPRTPRLRTLIADDHPLVLAGLRTVLGAMPQVDLVAEAATVNELLDRVATLQPDLVVTDLAMPTLDGLVALGEVRRRVPRARVLVVSVHDSPDIVRQAAQQGAHGYVLKSAAPLELGQAIDAMAAGRPWFSPELTAQLLAPAEPRAETVLTPRQLEILRRLAMGESSKQIAFELGLSAKTVHTHRARILERLQLRDAVGLALYSVRHGLVDPARLKRPPA